MLNMVKAVWSVWVGTPRPASLWTPGRSLAVWWKFGLDTLMVSGLGELVSCCPLGFLVLDLLLLCMYVCPFTVYAKPIVLYLTDAF